MSAVQIRVGAAAPPFHIFADYLDGERAVVRRAVLTIQGEALLIAPPGLPVVRWPLADIRMLQDQAGTDMLVLACESDQVARLLLDDDELLRTLPPRCRNIRSKRKTRGRGKLLAWSVAALSSVALIIFVLVPVLATQLAALLPPAGEKALGEATLRQIRGALDESGLNPVEICDGLAGRAALDKIQARLSAGADLPYPVTSYVLDFPLVSAFALPGGNIVLFRGLIQAAQSPDEVAAVFAHEMGHVKNRDPARGALRTAGSIGVLGLLLGDFAGGTVVLFLANQLINATYSQRAEAAADSYARDRLLSVGLRPAALATFFERLKNESGETKGIVAHFSAHPQLGDRIAAARAVQATASGFETPALDDVDWAQLRSVCN
ncbi:MAG: M48 family metallopeptidase [Halocynthiibacter sp.]